MDTTQYSLTLTIPQDVLPLLAPYTLVVANGQEGRGPAVLWTHVSSLTPTIQFTWSSDFQLYGAEDFDRSSGPLTPAVHTEAETGTEYTLSATSDSSSENGSAGDPSDDAESGTSQDATGDSLTFTIKPTEGGSSVPEGKVVFENGVTAFQKRYMLMGMLQAVSVSGPSESSAPGGGDVPPAASVNVVPAMQHVTIDPEPGIYIWFTLDTDLTTGSIVDTIPTTASEIVLQPAMDGSQVGFYMFVPSPDLSSDSDADGDADGDAGADADAGGTAPDNSDSGDTDTDDTDADGSKIDDTETDDTETDDTETDDTETDDAGTVSPKAAARKPSKVAAEEGQVDPKVGDAEDGSTSDQAASEDSEDPSPPAVPGRFYPMMPPV